MSLGKEIEKGLSHKGLNQPMLEKPNIKDELILSRLQEEYDLRVIELTFLPIGANMRATV